MNDFLKGWKEQRQKQFEQAFNTFRSYTLGDLLAQETFIKRRIARLKQNLQQIEKQRERLKAKLGMIPGSSIDAFLYMKEDESERARKRRRILGSIINPEEARIRRDASIEQNMKRAAFLLDGEEWDKLQMSLNTLNQKYEHFAEEKSMIETRKHALDSVVSLRTSRKLGDKLGKWNEVCRLLSSEEQHALLYTDAQRHYIKATAKLMHEGADAEILRSGKGKMLFWEKVARSMGNVKPERVIMVFGSELRWHHRKIKWDSFRETVLKEAEALGFIKQSKN